MLEKTSRFITVPVIARELEYQDCEFNESVYIELTRIYGHKMRRERIPRNMHNAT